MSVSLLTLWAYLPTDRVRAISTGAYLPEYTKGAALFVDISGYTPATKAFREKMGIKAGSESLTQQINTIFEALISEVHQYQGSVISFEGDALTCWFDQDTGIRALTCAWQMQCAMERFPELVVLPDISIPLSVKVGIAVGPVRRFLVGDPKIRVLDVLAGSTVNEMALATQMAEAKEIVISATLAAQLSDAIEVKEIRLNDERKEFAVVSRLKHLSEAQPWQPTSINIGRNEIASYLLPSIYDRLLRGQSQFLGEFRQVVALFLKFDGIDYDHDQAAGKKLHQLVHRVQEILKTYKGHLIKLPIGDKGSKLLVTFGAPISAPGNDVLQAIAAALELRTIPQNLDFITSIQIGLSQGWMLAGAFGSISRRAYDVLGDEANIAARLMSQARNHQILIDYALKKQAIKAFDVQDLEPIMLKGISKPFPVALVLGRRDLPSERAITHFKAPLIGREQELGELQHLLEIVKGKQGIIIGLEGAPGIGKSHLIDNFPENTLEQDVNIMFGECQNISQHIPYTPWRQIMYTLLSMGSHPPNKISQPDWHSQQREQLAQVLRHHNPDWLKRLPLLGELLDISIEDNQVTSAFESERRQQALFTLIVDIIRHYAQNKPLLLVIEDIHWFDTISKELFLFLSRNIADISVMLLVTYRSQGADLNLKFELDQLSNYRHLAVHPLSQESIVELATSNLTGQPSMLLADFLYRWTEGNPFYTEELLGFLKEKNGLVQDKADEWTLSPAIREKLQQTKSLVRDGEEWIIAPEVSSFNVELGLPNGIEILLSARLDQLTESQQLMTKIASTIGYRFEFEVLAQTYPTETLRETILDDIQGLAEAGLIQPEQHQPELTYIFRHHLTQEVAYNRLLGEQQQSLHQYIGLALEKLYPQDIDRLAYHFYEGKEQDKALHYLELAASKAQREYANEAALAYYNKAWLLEQSWQWLVGQIEVLHLLARSGRHEEEAALQLLNDRDDVPIFKKQYLWAQYYEAKGQYDKAREALERVIRDEDTNLVNKIRCLRLGGVIARRQGNYDLAEQTLRQALSYVLSGQFEETDKVQLKAKILNELGAVYNQKSKFPEAEKAYLEALNASQLIQNNLDAAESLSHLGVLHFYQRNFNKAITYSQQSLELRRKIGDRVGEGISLENWAQQAADRGYLSQAYDYLMKALHIQQTSGNKWEEANIWNGLGIVNLYVGHLNEAERCIQQSRKIYKEIGDEGGEVYFLGNLALILREQGAFSKTVQTLKEGLNLAQSQPDLMSMFYSHLGRLYLLMKNFEQAVTQAQQAIEIRQELQQDIFSTADYATLASAYCNLNRPNEAFDAVQQAMRILDECAGEGPEFPHHDYFLCYQVLKSLSQNDLAQVALESAYTLTMRKAEKITDPAFRHSFLERVRQHQEIIATAQHELPNV